MLGRKSFGLDNISVVQPNFDTTIASQYNQAPIEAVDAQISEKCNQVCPNCWGPTHHRRPLSQTQEIRLASDWEQLFGNLDDYASRTVRVSPDGTNEPAPLPRIIFTGAEPLLSEMLGPALRKVKSMAHLGRVTVSSNCITNSPGTETRFSEMLGLLTPGVDELAAPVEGSTDAVVEMVRPGSTALGARGYALKGGLRAQDAGVLFKPRTVVCPRRNVLDLPAIPASMRDAGIDLATIPNWKCGQPQPPASKYEQTANWPNADTWAQEWGISREHVLSAVIGAAALYPELKTKVQLYADTTGRYNMQVDPYGIAYTLIINRDGLPREVVFGDIMSDFSETMQRYNLFYSLTHGIKLIGQNVLGDLQDTSRFTHLLSAMLAEGYGTIANSWLVGYDRYKLTSPQLNQSHNPNRRTASPADLAVTFDHHVSQMTASQWHDNLSQLAEGGLEHITLGLGWETDETHNDILSAVESLPRVRLNVTANNNSNELDKLMRQNKIDRVVIPLEIASELNGGRLEAATQNILGSGQTLAIVLARHAVWLGQKITLQIDVTEQNFGLMSQLPSALERVLGATSSNMVSIELVEKEPLEHQDKNRQNFEHDGLTMLAENLRLHGCTEVRIKPWAYTPGRRFSINADGNVSSEDISAEGKVLPYTYGSATQDTIADILAKRQRHARSIADRRRNITNLDMPHGYKDSVLEASLDDARLVLTTADPQRILQGKFNSDALARYYHGVRVQSRIASLALS